MTRSDLLTVALPKGKLYEDTVQLLGQAGLPTRELLTDTRKLVFYFPEEAVRYIICRPTDIPTYVESGAADIGVVGKDTIVEQNKDVVECVDLKFGYCRFVVALPDEVAKTQTLQHLNHRRVATKFPQVAASFFEEKGLQMEVIKLHGNIELAPAVGLAEMIVDIVSSGRTLKENKLTAVEDIFQATARLIVNRVSYRLNHDRIHPLVEKVRDLVRDAEIRC